MKTFQENLAGSCPVLRSLTLLWISVHPTPQRKPHQLRGNTLNNRPPRPPFPVPRPHLTFTAALRRSPAGASHGTVYYRQQSHIPTPQREKMGTRDSRSYSPNPGLSEKTHDPGIIFHRLPHPHPSLTTYSTINNNIHSPMSGTNMLKSGSWTRAGQA